MAYLYNYFLNSSKKFQEGGVPEINKRYSKNGIEDITIFNELLNQYGLKNRNKHGIIMTEADQNKANRELISKYPDRDTPAAQAQKTQSAIAKATTEFPLSKDYLQKEYTEFLLDKEMSGKKSPRHLKKFNNQGYVGAFQFGVDALKGVGKLKSNVVGKGQREVILNPNNWIGGKAAMNEFLSSYDVQERMAKKLAAKNYKKIKMYLPHAGVTNENDIAALLAAAHLSGATNIIKYLANGGKSGFHDANGTTIDHYRKGFLKKRLNLDDDQLEYYLSKKPIKSFNWNKIYNDSLPEDFSHMKSRNQAFGEARKKGLSTFRYKNGTYSTERKLIGGILKRFK